MVIKFRGGSWRRMKRMGLFNGPRLGIDIRAMVIVEWFVVELLIEEVLLQHAIARDRLSRGRPHCCAHLVTGIP